MGIFNFRKWEGRGVAADTVQTRVILQNWLRPESIDFKDVKYRAISWEDYAKLREYVLPNPPYAEDIWDCDDFTQAYLVDINRAWAKLSRGKEALLHGWIKGLILNEKGERVFHAWAWHVDDTGAGRFIEPQHNKERTGVEYTFEMRA